MPVHQSETIRHSMRKDVASGSGKPSARRVTFPSGGVQLVGTLYSPEDAPATLRRPGIVVTGSWTTVKEQMAALYASRLANAGFFALAFDSRGFGESAGEVRDHECPMMKAEDICAAFSFLETVPDIDPHRLGALALCASAGYAATAAVADSRVRSLALVAPWLHDAGILEQLYGKDGLATRMAKGRAARAEYEDSQVVESVPAVSTVDPEAAMYGPFDYYLDPARGGIAQWSNRFAVMSWIDWLEFDAHRIASRVAVPTLLVHSEQAAIPEGARRFHAAMKARGRFLWTSGTQFDFYDQEPTVSFAAQAAVDHFQSTL
jgi:uncharacterized protein